ncbi:hypothetical protein ASZ90_001322 [hydrocarbon metagenome]|uniref:Uncharacterized protein n=1 Tax=hydrocarbon metagenome TaxID=938273 RepID=A0A0W8G6M2_9ZZZZ
MPAPRPETRRRRLTCGRLSPLRQKACRAFGIEEFDAFRDIEESVARKA